MNLDELRARMRKLLPVFREQLPPPTEILGLAQARALAVRFVASILSTRKTK